MLSVKNHNMIITISISLCRIVNTVDVNKRKMEPVGIERWSGIAFKKKDKVGSVLKRLFIISGKK